MALRKSPTNMCGLQGAKVTTLELMNLCMRALDSQGLVSFLCPWMREQICVVGVANIATITRCCTPEPFRESLEMRMLSESSDSSLSSSRCC